MVVAGMQSEDNKEKEDASTLLLVVCLKVFGRRWD